MSFNPHQWYLMGLRQAIAHLTLSTTSTSATWSPQQVINLGATLTWDVTGNITPTSQNVDDPTFNLSANTGTVNMDVYNVNQLELIYCYSNQLTLFDISDATDLLTVICYDNQLTTLDTSKNIRMSYLSCPINQIASLDLSNNINLATVVCYWNNMSPSATDQIYIDLANGIGVNGSLAIRNNRTSASDAARATLVSRGWTFNESYTT